MKNSSLQNFSPQKILICQLRQIGDVLLATPAIKLLAQKFPQAKIYFYTEKKCAPLLENNPYLYKIISLDRKQLKNFLTELKFYRQIAKQNFDLIVDFQQLPRIRWVIFFSKAKIKLTYTPPWYNKILYSQWVNSLPGYAAYCKLSILRALDIDPQIIPPQVYLRENEILSAQNYLKKLKVKPDNLFLTFDPTHRRKTRCWPSSHYIQLGQLIKKHHPQTKILLLYGPKERNFVEPIYKSDKNLFILPDKVLSLREMAAIISLAKMHIGNCSAPRHIAVAVNTPSFTILGATSSAWTYPKGYHYDIKLGLKCQPCNKNHCEHINCLVNLSPQTVWNALQPKLDALILPTK
ncbi:heptosyltransferase-2 [Desulfonauticus submarinus]|uniref:Heptosyltransferase-2 n=1 Tax=Desulfonauticus submarinus TaxID=206665 RepID=A0A1H0FQ68_9BACT|nr:glycosyltransferase family 9 protein [Desulfonauticus submarinus]SDN96681.1 heptosyltransferase-2 [Desulfonauticus submarinus]